MERRTRLRCASRFQRRISRERPPWIFSSIYQLKRMLVIFLKRNNKGIPVPGFTQETGEAALEKGKGDLTQIPKFGLVLVLVLVLGALGFRDRKRAASCN